MRVKFLILSLFAFIVCFANCNFATAQNLNQIKSKCPSGISGYGSLLVQSDGNINALPCTGRNFLINGAAVPSGTGTANYFPIWNSSSTLTNSIWRYTNTLATWNGFTANTFNLFDYSVATDKSYYIGNPNSYIQFLKGIDAGTSRETNVWAKSPNGTHYGYFSAFTDNTFGEVAMLSTTRASVSSPFFRALSLTGSTDWQMQVNTDLANGLFFAGNVNKTFGTTTFFNLDNATNRADLQTANGGGGLHFNSGNIAYFLVLDTLIESNAATVDFGTDLFKVTNINNFNSQFTLEVVPNTATGRFRVGDFTTTPTNWIDLNQATGIFTVNTTGNIGSVSTAGNITFDSAFSTDFIVGANFNVSTTNGNAIFDVSAGNDNFTVTTGTGTTTFTTNQFRISEDLAFANATPCIAEATLDAAGVFDIAGAGNPCYASGDYVFTTGITATGSLRVSALGLVTSSAGAGDAVQTFRYWIIKRY